MERIRKAVVAVAVIAIGAFLAELTVKAGCLMFLAVFSPSTLASL